ncbi:MFS transporter [Nocardioides sp. Y6]|uniref:MFS transporter n=1 Tax=Nocardioides malaquae TaxID=2773426 RepID=A0ABR9RV10_9ACTN|nr:MFS transporter [Nocardioides malaquae]MBE7325408.1 MFS transporter [Nocardioides malaquae]
MTAVDAPPARPTGHPEPRTRRTGRWIEDWRPEEEAFWEETGRPVARRNLWVSIFAEHLGFSVWLIWSVSSAYLVASGFDFTAQELFVLIALPNLVGSLLRVPYTLAVPIFGGRNWTVVSALLLLIPSGLFVWAVQNPTTPYWVFCLIAATAGFGGGNFASSMANINFFYPAAKKGAALGLNAAGGNLGVALIQFGLPVVVGGAGVFGLVKASDGGIHLERAGWVYVALSLVAAALAFRFMDNLATAEAKPREQLSVLKQRHTWIMAFLYIGTFGSFIGYSAAMPLLIKLNFFVPTPAPTGTGINFAYYAFLGALVGSLTRPFGGWLADRFGGARVTLYVFFAMVAGTLGVLWTLTQLTPNPTADPAIALDNQAWFPAFLAFFLFVFAATGIGNGSTYRMIPTIWRTKALEACDGTEAGRTAAIGKATKSASAAIGIIGAVGAIGGFLIPMTFGAPWVADPVAAVRSAFLVFSAFYLVCAGVTWAVYLRRSVLVARFPSLAPAGV